MNATPLLLNLNIPVSPMLLYILFAVFILLWIVFTFILVYHWKKYSVSNLDLLKMNLVYFIGSGVIIVLMGASAFLYSIPS